MTTFARQCEACAHYLKDHTCPAFPSGIRPAVFFGVVPHKDPLPGDHGIQFKKGGVLLAAKGLARVVKANPYHDANGRFTTKEKVASSGSKSGSGNDAIDQMTKMWGTQSAEKVEVIGRKDPKSKAKSCYDNAYRYATTHKDTSYVLGYYLMMGVPIEHAWVKEKGQHVDVTLNDGPEKGEYYKVVEFNQEELLDYAVKANYPPMLYEYARSLRTAKKGLSLVLKANDCHHPAGSPQGGQFCSKERSGVGEAKDYVFYHGTTKPEVIESGGFKVVGVGGGRNSGGPYGEGIYLAVNRDFAKGYARGDTGAVLEVTGHLKLKKMTPFEYGATFSTPEFTAWYQEESGKPNPLTVEGLMSKWFADQGYDGVLINIDGKLDQAVVFDPSKLKPGPRLAQKGEVQTSSLSKGLSKVLKANDCHHLAGSPKGGQFCSKDKDSSSGALDTPIEPMGSMEVVEYYQDRGYQLVNDYLRGVDVPEEASRKARSAVQALDDLFEDETPRDTYTYRGEGGMVADALFDALGISAELGGIRLRDIDDYFSKTPPNGSTAFDPWGEYFTETLMGAFFEDKGYMSTTRDKNLAIENFAHGGSEISKYGASGILEIVGKGIKSLEMDSHSTMGAGESEILLPRGTRLQIDRVKVQPTDRGFILVYQAHVIKNGE